MAYDTRLDLKVAIKVISPENTEGGLPAVSAY
jgi:hypothetical protein